ncbi:hypothetical protein KNP414_01668 [Paenibacillus mucilaginosus KNP414]|nr:hypothetical protein KNP414_01668 [Paenibacillus mucilaginosus KNP414]
MMNRSGRHIQACRDRCRAYTVRPLCVQEAGLMREGSALRGTVIGILFTLPIWALIIWGISRWIG